MKKQSLWLTVVVAVQIALMAGMALSKEMNLKSGNVVLLETLPIDPRDLLRGDFVILNYKISELPPIQGVGEGHGLGATPVYVTLEKLGQFHEAVTASYDPVKAGRGQVVARGSLDESRGAMRVTYGIEKFYVREGTGNPNGVVTVSCVVLADGSLQIKEVFLDGRPYAQVMAERAR